MNQGTLFRRLTLPGILVSLALLLSLLERMLPLDLLFPVPGLRLGLPNIVTLFALWALPLGTALAVVVVRCLLGAFFGGSLSALIFSLAGGLLALAVMAALLPFEGEKLSIAGVSVAGAAAHNLGQLFAARFVMGTWSVFAYLPFLLAGSLVTGLATGLAFSAMRPALSRVPALQPLLREKRNSTT